MRYSMKPKRKYVKDYGHIMWIYYAYICVSIHNESHKNYNLKNQTQFYTSYLRSNLCDFSDA